MKEKVFMTKINSAEQHNHPAFDVLNLEVKGFILHYLLKIRLKKFKDKV